MSLWLTRAGRHGEHEAKFLSESRIYLTWNGLDRDLKPVADKVELREILKQFYPTFTRGHIINNSGQVWQFVKEMQPGDWVVLPSKMKPAIHFAEIKGEYRFNANAENPFYHYREVKWIATDIPRSRFDQDLLYSFGAFMTVCEISRNDAERRVRAMVGGTGKPATQATKPETRDEEEEEEGIEPEEIDLAELARDSIAKLISARFKGHDMQRLVDAILRAQGYVTWVSPHGPDKGVDILAAPGPLGFGQPRICVQVKSEQSPIDRPTLDQLIGTMQNVHADQGLLVAWGGFKQSVERELPNQFFRVRLWDQKSLIEELLGHYDSLDADIRAELPLKRIWTVAMEEEE